MASGGVNRGGVACLGTSLTHIGQPVLKEIAFFLWHGSDAERELTFRTVESGGGIRGTEESIHPSFQIRIWNVDDARLALLPPTLARDKVSIIIPIAH